MASSRWNILDYIHSFHLDVKIEEAPRYLRISRTAGSLPAVEVNFGPKGSISSAFFLSDIDGGFDRVYGGQAEVNRTIERFFG